MKIYNYSGRSRKRTPSGREKGVRNWSWLLTSDDGSRKAATRVVRDRWPLTGACPANNKHWKCKIKFHRINFFFFFWFYCCMQCLDNAITAL